MVGKEKQQKVFKVDYDDLGMNIASETLINLCKDEKKCKFFKMQAVFGLCKNSVCYLSLQYNLRYKKEGYGWEDMYFNMREGCFCFSTAEIFSKCDIKNTSVSLCRKVIDSFSEPISEGII